MRILRPHACTAESAAIIWSRADAALELKHSLVIHGDPLDDRKPEAAAILSQTGL
jgi:hypothetical protein